MAATTSLGVTRPSSVDSPLMAALGNTNVGSWMNDNHIQVYGWVNAGGNLSNNTVKGGNAPAAYDYNPNTVQLDQAVVYIERLPDTVQKDHVDWGFRIAPIYGENYRYTTAYGLFSSQLLNQNLNNGFDIPMAYGEVFIPQVMEGLMIRIGRYISIPGHRGAARAEQLHVYALDDVYVRQLHQHRHRLHAGGHQELDVPARPDGRHRGAAVACRRNDRQSGPEPALSEHRRC